MADHEKAKAWREKLGLTVEQLSDRVGYSIESIYLFEKGYTYAGRTPKKGSIRKVPLTESVWKRYRLACAAVAADLDKFNWRSP